jgi:hypothetical protein
MSSNGRKFFIRRSNFVPLSTSEVEKFLYLSIIFSNVIKSISYNKKLLKILDLLADAFIMVLAFVMLIVGWQYATTLGAKASYVSLPKLSKFWMYFPIPIAGFAMIIFELEAIYNHIKGFFIKGEDK